MVEEYGGNYQFSKASANGAIEKLSFRREKAVFHMIVQHANGLHI